MTDNVSSLPTALSMQMPITNRIQILKRRSRSLSSDSSSFSLPFKKRRFVIISDNEEDDHQEQRETMVTSPTLGVASFKGIACITPVPSTLKERQVSTVPKEIPKLLLACGKAKTIVSSSPHFTIYSEPMQTRRRSKNNQSSEAPLVDTNRQSKRMSHPKLDSPLPNGCHGKTSRTQSFCRRGPNYNGSNYCKLHYFDPRYNNKSTIKEENKSTENSKNEESISDTTTIAKVTGSENKPIAPPRNENESIAKTNNNNKEPDGLVLTTRNTKSKQQEKRAPRDKLYRGPTGNSAQDGSGVVEVRCLAISTRGKRCCYAAVTSNGNEYCHRHSSFKGSDDKNGTATDAIKTTKTKSKTKTKTNVAPVEESLANLNTTTLSSCSRNRRNRSSATSQKAVLTADASDPRSPNALSDLSTDLWQNRRVLVSKGPHQSKIGTVVRWRNGWVTVELTGNAKTKNPVFHNRRSYELILV